MLVENFYAQAVRPPFVVRHFQNRSVLRAAMGHRALTIAVHSFSPIAFRFRAAVKDRII
jgi:hypothetical protein